VLKARDEPVTYWVAETRDLKEAKALLESLVA
jgi:hypothetical protein